MIVRRLFAFLGSLSAPRPSPRSREIQPMDPRDERELELLRQRREMRERGVTAQDDGGAAQ